MALNLGRGGVQEIGVGQANALLGSQQALRTERVADARATAGMELKRMQEEADAMGISMGRYVERNAERFKGAMTTLYGGGRNARERAETSYGEVLNGPETKEQLERYTESEWWRENGRGVDWAPPMGESGQGAELPPREGGGQTAPATPAEPTFKYANDAGGTITEEQYNNQQGTYEAYLEAGDPEAARMIKPEDRDAMLAYLEEEARAGNEWARQKLEKYNDPANFDPENPYASALQNEIMTSIVREVNGGQNRRGNPEFSTEVLRVPQAYEQYLQSEAGKVDGIAAGAEADVVNRQFNDLLNPQEQMFALTYIQNRDIEGATKTGQNVLNRDSEVWPDNMPDNFYASLLQRGINLDEWPKPDMGGAAGTPPEMRLRGFNRIEVTPQEESAPTPPPQPMQRGRYFGDVQKFEEDYQQSTGSELNRTNQQLVAARQAKANVAKTVAETDYLRAREDSEYVNSELAYNKALEAIKDDLNEVDQKTAISALNDYDSLVSSLGFAPPQYVDSASLQTYVRRLGASGREDYAEIMGSFADQVDSNPTLQDYFEVRTVYTTDAAEARDESGTPSGRDVSRARKVRIVVPRSRGRAGTTQSELGDRLVSET